LLIENKRRQEQGMDTTDGTSILNDTANDDDDVDHENVNDDFDASTMMSNGGVGSASAAAAAESAVKPPKEKKKRGKAVGKAAVVGGKSGKDVEATGAESIEDLMVKQE
jgi:uncharacterized protein (DUF2147 family)